MFQFSSPGGGGPLLMNPSKQFWMYDDFVSSTTDEAFCDYTWVQSSSGTGAQLLIDTTSNVTQGHPGVARCETGTTTSGRCAGYFASNTFDLTIGTWTKEWLVNIPALSDATDEYDISIGFGDLPGGVNQTDGVYFLYNRTASVNWQMATAKGNTRTETATSTAVATGWTKLKIVARGADSEADYYINGTLVGTVTTNYPSSVQTGLFFGIHKSAGTTSRDFLVDYMMLSGEFTADRQTL